jgi:hypothetical protein
LTRDDCHHLGIRVLFAADGGKQFLGRLLAVNQLCLHGHEVGKPTDGIETSQGFAQGGYPLDSGSPNM